MTRKHILSIGLVVAALGLAALGCESVKPEASIATQRQGLEQPANQAILGFETPAAWTASAGTLTATSDAEQGTGALAWSGGGYVELSSAPLSTLGGGDASVTYRLKVPLAQSNPDWLGQTQLIVDAPSQGIQHQFVQAVELTGNVELGAFNTIAFTLPENIANVLGNDYDDLRIKLVLNVPFDAPGSYVFDDLRVGGAPVPPPGGDDDGAAPEVAVSDFESPLSWQSTNSQIALDSDLSFLGETSLSVAVTGPATVTSLPLRTIAGISRANNLAHINVMVPLDEPATLSLFLTSPSLGLASVLAGSADLGGFPAGAFRPVSFELSDTLVDVLASASYDDLVLTFALSVNAGAERVYRLDGLVIGNLNRRGYDPSEPEAGADEAALEEPLLEDDGEPGVSILATFREAPGLKFPDKPQGPETVVDSEAPTCVASNLVQNPGFESGTQGWFVFGSATLSASTQFKHSGFKSARVSNRTATWQGPAYSLLGSAMAGLDYDATAWAMTAGSGSQPLLLTAKIVCAGAAPEYRQLAATTAASGTWKKLSGELVLPLCDLSELTIYVEGPAAGVTLYVDDVSVRHACAS
ncbi:MAG TPA: carbohydrate binding domain-containing protein [Polyangiaceae bacterium]